jgi:hypothetical protein
MIVVGGWPGRIVVGLDGRFGVRPAAFAALGDFPSPFADDADLPGDATTEFVGVVQTLPASGTVVFTDEGGFSHTGAADGTYTTTFRLYTWAQGGPITEHTPDEVLTTSFGVVSVPGATLVATASLVTGVASGSIGAAALGATLAAAASLLAGTATGQRNATAAAATLGASASLVPGSAAGAASGTALGVTLAAGAGLLAGAATGAGSGTAPGVVLSLSAALLSGAALAPDRTVAGVVLTASAGLVTGAATGPASASLPGALLTANASASWGAAFQAPTTPAWLVFTTVLPSSPVIRTVLP